VTLTSFLLSTALAAPPIAGPTGGAPRAELPTPVLPDHPMPVVGGAPATPGRWPDAAALYTLDDSFGCTGTLIAPDLVLTAGHCGFGMHTVVVGTDDQRDPELGETLDVLESIVHDDSNTTFDVAVLVLAQPAEHVVPRVLALDCVAEDYLRDDGEVAIVGYGATDPWASEWTSVLMEAWTTIRDATCSDLTVGCNASVSPGGELVAGGDGVDSCQGDSGGPLYVSTPFGDFLAGTTSRAALPLTTPCGGGGIYVRADAIADWVEDVTGRLLERPPCAGWNRAPHPSADAVTAMRGGIVGTWIEPGDPDVGDAHTYRIAGLPAQGDASVDADGRLLVTVPFDAVAGSDTVLVEVTDDGAPPQTGEVAVEMLIPPAPDSSPDADGGCNTSQRTPALAGLLALLLLRRRWPRG
jgi:MYXO-CTERM domain-containing protein